MKTIVLVFQILIAFNLWGIIGYMLYLITSSKKYNEDDEWYEIIIASFTWPYYISILFIKAVDDATKGNKERKDAEDNIVSKRTGPAPDSD